MTLQRFLFSLLVLSWLIPIESSHAYGVSGVLGLGDNYFCAVKDNNNLICWSRGNSGQILGKFVQVSLGYKNSASIHGKVCALETTGKVLCWEATYTSGTFTYYRPLEGDFIQVNAGGNTNNDFEVCGIKNDGALACFGSWIKTTPSGTFTQVSVGNNYACAIRTDGRIKCWGDDKKFSNIIDNTPSGTFKVISAGTNRVCAINTEGKIVCWGEQTLSLGRSQPPSGSFNHISEPIEGTSSCAVRNDNKVVCWGYNGKSANNEQTYMVCNGEVCTPKLYFPATSSKEESISPTTDKGDKRAIPPDEENFISVETAGYFSCGIKPDFSIMCWGTGRVTPPDILTTVLNPSKSKPTGVLITPDVWINAEIQTVEKGIINGVWQLGGDSTTARGDRVIWGYFYANPADVSWGSKDNPDLYVKAWYDASGRIDVNFFHVSVPNINVYSAKNNGSILTGIATTDSRYVRHTYNSDNTQNADVFDTRNASVIKAQHPRDKAYDVITNSAIKTVEKGNIAGKIGGGGTSFTSRGDLVVWGYFHADPADVSWGNKNNPEVFIKVWGDVSGRIDVNFFHVSVPDIDVSSQLIDKSDVPITSTYNSTVTTDKRYSRHEYTPN